MSVLLRRFHGPFSLKILRPIACYTTTSTVETETGSHTTSAGTHSHTTGAVDLVRTSPTQEELENEEPWLQEEIKAYYRSKNTLAKMMGKDPNTFTEKDVQESIRYLLPSSLTDKAARPFLKHPSLVHPKRKQAEFDSTGRPLETAFFTGCPGYHNLILEIYRQERYLDTLDTGNYSIDSTKKVGGATAKWIEKEKMSNRIAEELNDERYKDLVSRLTSLAAHPLSHMIGEFLDKYRKHVYEYRKQAKLPVIDQGGYSHAVGRRKTSVAQVWLKKGTGNFDINKKSLIDFFHCITDRQQVLYPFVLTNLLGHYDVMVRVVGGGHTGQAGAIRLGISRALLAFPGEHSDILENAKLLVRDPRMVERKKPGQKKARKKFAWVKR